MGADEGGRGHLGKFGKGDGFRGYRELGGSTATRESHVSYCTALTDRFRLSATPGLIWILIHSD